MQERLIADLRSWDAIAGHRTGTDGDHATARWLADSLRAVGLEPDCKPFPFARRVLRECAVVVGGDRADGVPLFDGHLTDADGLTAPLAPATAADGCIGVAAFSSLGGGAANAELERARRAGQACAIVAHAATEDAVPGLALMNAPSYAAPFGPPVLQVATQHRDWLMAAAQAGVSARFVAHAELQETTACNVSAAVAGRKRGGKPVVIVTPRSSWWTSTAERGGGIAAWLACARHFAATPPARDVVLVATTGHELGHLGLNRFLAEHPPAAAHAWLHLGANFAAQDGTLRLQASEEWLPTALAALDAEDVGADSVMPAAAEPVGEAANIHAGRGRYASFVGTQRWFHHPEDRWPHAIDIERAERTCRAALRIAQAMAND